MAFGAKGKGKLRRANQQNALFKRKKFCRFTVEHVEQIDYKDIDTLRDFILRGDARFFNLETTLNKEGSCCASPFSGGSYLRVDPSALDTVKSYGCNMITTATMIKMGRVKGNKMGNMHLSNAKLVDRGTRMVVDELKLSYDEAKRLLLMHGSVKAAVDAYRGVVEE